MVCSACTCRCLPTSRSKVRSSPSCRAQLYRTRVGCKGMAPCEAAGVERMMWRRGTGGHGANTPHSYRRHTSRMAAAPVSLATAKAILAGRASGKYNLVGRNLDQLPPELFDERLPLPSAGPPPSSAAGGARGGQQGGPAWWETCEPQRLELSRNALTVVPEEVAGWAGLVLLDVSHNRLQHLPQGLCQLQVLGQLIANNNELVSLPLLPASLVVLQLSCNALRHVPAQCLSHCTSLTHLDLSHNQLEGLHAHIPECCTALTQLQLSHNRLQSLPPNLGNLRKLQVLHIEFNQLTQLPDSLATCKELLELHAGNNRLQQVPASLAYCAALRHLSVRDNQLSEWPGPLCGLQLQCLDLQNNNLSNLPPELGNMTTLRALLLDGNGLRTIRRALITGPVSALLKYLASRLPEDGPGAHAGAVVPGSQAAAAQQHPPGYPQQQPNPGWQGQPCTGGVPATGAWPHAGGQVAAPAHQQYLPQQRQPPGGYSTRPW